MIFAARSGLYIEMLMTGEERASWELAEGDAIAPGRTVLRRLGGGSAYEVFLVWDERLHAICVAKALRPDRVTEQRSLEDLREEAEILERVSHPVIVRGFDAVLEGTHPHLMIEHLEGPVAAAPDQARRRAPARSSSFRLALHLAAAPSTTSQRRGPRPPRREARQHHHGGYRPG